MRVLIIALMVLLPVVSWGAEKKVKEKVPVEDFRKDLEEDICYVYFDVIQSERSRGGNSNFSPSYDLKRSRLNTLTARYNKRYSENFDGYTKCPQMFPNRLY